MSLHTEIPPLAERINSMEGMTDMLQRIHHNETAALSSRSEQVMRLIGNWRDQLDLIRGAEMLGYITSKVGDSKGGGLHLFMTDLGRDFIGVERPFWMVSK